jgi:hypothetical protein
MLNISISCIVGFAFWFAVSSAAFAQQKSESQTSKGPAIPAESTTVHSSPGGAVAGSKVVRTRTESGGREVVTEVVELPGTDGRLQASTKTTTETIGMGSNAVKVKRNVFGNGAQGPLSLIETSEADQQKFPDGTSRTITNTWVPDLGGRLGLSSQRVQEVKPLGPDVQQTLTTVYVPGVAQALSETERLQETQRRVGSNLVQTDTQRNVRDSNGKWQTTEARNKEVRTVGPAEVVEEETVRSLDGDGRLALSERTVTRKFTTNGSEQMVTDVYSTNVAGMARASGSALELDHRIRVTTTPPMTNSGSQTITETEARNPSVINGSIQVVTRTVETVRQIGPDRWETQRQTFALDGTGRLVLTSDVKEESRGK